MNRWITIILLGGLALLGGVAGLWLYDEPLEPQTQAWLDQLAEPEAKSAAYLQLLGLDAPAGSDPLVEGRKRLSAANIDAEASGLAIPGDEICSLTESGCLQRLLQDREARGAHLHQHRELLQRYEELLTLEDYRTLSKVSMSEPMPAYGALIKANQLRALQALGLIDEKRGAEALQLLEQDIRQLRALLVDADSLIMKMALVNLLARDLDNLALLYHAELLPRPAIQPALSAAERDMLAAMRREFALVAHGLEGVAGDANMASMGFARWQLQLLYKPRMTINDSLSTYLRIAENARLDAQSFARQVRDGKSETAERPAPWRRLLNPVGVILGEVAVPDFNRYLARLHDLDAKIVLFNQLGREAQAGGNPYRPDQGPEWNAEVQRLCFDGPLPDHQLLRCLPGEA